MCRYYTAFMQLQALNNKNGIELIYGYMLAHMHVQRPNLFKHFTKKLHQQ